MLKIHHFFRLCLPIRHPSPIHPSIYDDPSFSKARFIQRNAIRINRFCAIPTKPIGLRQSIIISYRQDHSASPPPPVTHIFPLTHVPFNQQIAVPSSLLNVLSTSHRNIEKYNIKNKKKKKRQKKKRPKKRKIKHQFTKQKIPKSPKNKKSTKNRNTIKRKNIPKNDHQNEKKTLVFKIRKKHKKPKRTV